LSGGGPAEPRRVLGTAGHIDHGKTALVEALTGTDTDRLPEEKRRGITIDLGFAALELPGGERLSVIDVPGHEKLVRTMVSGVTGIDLVMLVVAADEGVMPQTREHVAICGLLGVERGVVALTKRDLVDEETIELASEEIRELLSGTALAGAPVVPCSAVTGDGVEALRAALAEVASAAPARTPRRSAPRLAIDRAFAMRGFGSVVTGTLVGDALEVGDAVELSPGGRRSKVRGLQQHGAERERVEPGGRCAVNLQGIEVHEISRGQVVTRPGSLHESTTLDLELHWLPTAPPVEDRAAVEFLAGTSERVGHLALIGVDRLPPGGRGFARMHVEGDPVALLPGDRFIVRGFARTEGSGGTLGGGRVLDVHPPHRRRSDPALLQELEVLAEGEPAGALRERIRRSGLSGVEEAQLARETGLEPTLLRDTLAALEAAGDAMPTGRRWLGREAVARMEDTLLAALRDYHAQESLRPGMSRSALRGRLAQNVASDASERVLERMVADGRIALARDVAHLPEFRPRLDERAEALAARMREEARAAGLEPPSARDWAARLSIDLDELNDLAAFLEREGALVRAPSDLWFASEAIEALKDRVRGHFTAHEELDTQTFKGLIGTTRRTAMPLMELLDDLRVTARRGDVRVLRGGA